VQPAACPRVAAVVPVGEAIGRVFLHDMDIAEAIALLQD